MAKSLKIYVDPNNANPSRLSRLPNAMRFDSRQELYALNIGAKSWQDFEAQIQAEAIGDRILLSELAEFDAENDPDNILGNRWLCKGGSCLFVGQSGIAKSSFVMQLAINWTLGRPTFGITPVRPLSCLVIQAENDAGDVAEQIQGAMSGLNLNVDDDAFAAPEQRLANINDSVNTGEQFTES